MMFFLVGRRHSHHHYQFFAVGYAAWSLINRARATPIFCDANVFSFDDDDTIGSFLTAGADSISNAPTDSEIGEELLFSSPIDSSPGPLSLFLSFPDTDPSLGPVDSDLDLDSSSIFGTGHAANSANLELNPDEWLTADSGAVEQAFFKLKPSDLVPLEQPQSDLKAILKWGEYKPRVVPAAFQICPQGYEKRLCCAGPGVPSLSNPNIYDAVLNCAELGMLCFFILVVFSWLFSIETRLRRIASYRIPTTPYRVIRPYARMKKRIGLRGISMTLLTLCMYNFQLKSASLLLPRDV